jgi:ribonuclease HI
VIRNIWCGAMMEGWARGWQKRNWTRSNKEKAANPDLWVKLIDLCAIHEVEFRWLKGHDGHAENERCDQLSMLALQQADLLVDEGYTPSTAEGVLSATDIESLWGIGLPVAPERS